MEGEAVKNVIEADLVPGGNPNGIAAQSPRLLSDRTPLGLPQARFR